MPLPLRGLYAITPEFNEEKAFLSRLTLALRHGVRILQYRDKRRNARDQARLACEIAALCRAEGVCFIVNDHPELAQIAHADGVHLGRDDGAIANARRLLGKDKLIGVSCYNDLTLAQRAVREGADYVAFGAVFPSPTKPNAVHAPLSLITQAKQILPVPVCAIGGVTLATAPSILKAGADLLAVITDLFNAPDIAQQAQAYHHLFLKIQGDPS